MTTVPRGWLRAGRAGSPHGLDGSFHVAEANASLLSLGAVIRIGDEERPITRRAGTDARPILRIEGHDDRAAAEALRGLDILVTRDNAPALESEEWWAEDLESCRVCDGAREVGQVKRLLALPSCEVLEVKRGDGAPDLLVPLIRDAVRRVDVEHGEIDIDLAFLGEE
ncbi:MAG TPA: ribosome maturation factor RimM [Solirubrobacteraceae bacterium]|jgi:16S rRNA processing protein RimM|nr:ribosome maturation factor RimM [Solirubrobacteraceae bacterium]